MQWIGGVLPPDAVPHDWQAGTRQEGSVGAAPARTSTGLQQHPVCGDWLFTALSDVWEASSSPC